MMLNIQKVLALGSGDFIEVYTFRCSPTCTLHKSIFFKLQENQNTDTYKLFQETKLCVGLKSPFPHSSFLIKEEVTK